MPSGWEFLDAMTRADLHGNSAHFSAMPADGTRRRSGSSAIASAEPTVIATAIAMNASWNVPVVSRTQPMKYGIIKPDDTPMLVMSAMPAAAARSVRIRLGNCQKVLMLQKHAEVPIASTATVASGDDRYSALASVMAESIIGPATYSA